MNRTAYIFLLFAVFLQSTSYLWIFAGFQLNRDLIAEQLCINRFDAVPLCKGSCYIEEQVNIEQQREDTTIKFKFSEVIVGLPTSQQVIGAAVEVIVPIKIQYCLSSTALADGFLISIFRPPIPRRIIPNFA